MEVLLSGIDFPHEIGEFCQFKRVPYYTILCFTTPFLYYQDGVMCHGSTGQLLINPPGSLCYHGPSGPTESFRNHWLHITPDLKPLLERYPLPLNTAFSLPDQTLIPDAIRRITREQVLRRPGFAEKVDCLLTQLIIDLHRLHLRGPDRTGETQLEEARNTFLGAPERQWSLEEMARLSGYSPSRFSALYQNRFGISPKAELLTVRLDLAKQMLRYSDLSVTSIAAACGFQSVYYFSKYFRKHTGLSPTQWAERISEIGD